MDPVELCPECGGVMEPDGHGSWELRPHCPDCGETVYEPEEED